MFTVADIPGIIEGAAEGKGLGHDFLRHIERAPFLAYVIDMAGVDGRNPWTDYSILRKELEFYQEGLASRPSLVVANKMDLPEAKNNLTLFRKKTKTRPVPVSALTGDNLDKLREAMLALCAKKKKPPRKRR
jgi:GTP-binding protein